MNTLAVINAAVALLDTLPYTVHHADALDIDAEGGVTLPKEEPTFIVYVVDGDTEFQWGSARYSTVTLQINAVSVVDGEPLAMLAQAEPLLMAAKFLPGIQTRLSRSGAFTGYAQRFEKGV